MWSDAIVMSILCSPTGVHLQPPVIAILLHNSDDSFKFQTPLNEYAFVYSYVYIYIYTHIYTFMYMHIYIYICVYVCVCVGVCVCVCELYAYNQSINHYSFNDKYFELTQPQLE